MPRLLFEKTGNAVWISHLDLMRLFQRAFKRAGLHLTHTQGFNPRPSVSIALPLSVGVASACELLDFDLDGDMISTDEICIRLNRALVEGVRVVQVYETGRKLRELSLLQSDVTMEYDNGVPSGAVEAIYALFGRNQLTVPKKTKSGVQDQDLIPMIRNLQVMQCDKNTVTLELLGCCQNPTLNPMQLPAAISLYLPQFAPTFCKCNRVEIYDDKENVFR